VRKLTRGVRNENALKRCLPETTIGVFDVFIDFLFEGSENICRSEGRQMFFFITREFPDGSIFF